MPARRLTTPAARALAATLVLASGHLHAGIDPPDPAAFKYRAGIVVTQAAPYVVLPLPASVYAHSERGDLRDLRLIDARGDRVPFALLPPREAPAPVIERRRTAALYPLPPRNEPGDGHAPLDIRIDGGRILIRQAAGAAPAQAQPKPQAPAGWLIDLGPTEPGALAPQALVLGWAASAEFSALFDLSVSDDLRSWRPAGSGQLLSLHAADAPLVQDRVPLPAAGQARYLRLNWADARQAPVLIAAQAITRQVDPPAPEAAVTLRFDPRAPDADRALHFDLGGVLPLTRVDLQGPAGSWVAPIRWQGRQRDHEPWQLLGTHVHYRLDRNGQVSVSEPLTVDAQVRFLRATTDERVAPVDPRGVRLQVQAALASLVFVSQGVPPYALLAGARQAPASALPATTLIADLEAQRAHFGHATLESWHEDAAAVRAAQDRERQAAMRPWLLWAVLLTGVAGLGAMVWRLARGSAGKT